MASDRTFVTELATGLGTLGDTGVAAAIDRRPAEMADLTARDWDRMSALWEHGELEDDFRAGFANGEVFLTAPDALNGRIPRLVEWTGARRPLGDETVPSDLRIDHVYLVSCKYLSRILHNPSPARLVDVLLTHAPVDDARDWYERVAPVEYQELYEVCLSAVHKASFPSEAGALNGAQRRSLAGQMRDGWPDGAHARYSRLCEVVSEATAGLWKDSVGEKNAEAMLWRLLRIGSAPYYILGTSSTGSMRLRIDSPWDWRRRYRFLGFDVTAQRGGQPRVGWEASYEDRRCGAERTVSGHVEIRWSHGRFAQRPEAKVYLDTAHEEVPGYHLLERSRTRAGKAHTGDSAANGQLPRQAELWESP